MEPYEIIPPLKTPSDNNESNEIREIMAEIEDAERLASPIEECPFYPPNMDKEVFVPFIYKKKGSHYGLIAAFVVPIFIMIAVFVERGIFPFGDSSFLRTDMYHQYAPFFSDFQNKLLNGNSLYHSWDIGMGVNFVALYAYYLASPLNWLVILCPKGFLIEFLTYMIVFKIGLCGFTFAYYISKHCNTKTFGVAFFGIFYALSGYMAAYSWNIMWLDCILLFPLIVLGLERLVKKNKCFLYCITLGLSILSNYYISIMICIFMVFYFVALLIMEEKRTWKRYSKSFFQFSLYSLLAGGLAAAILLPEIYALQTTVSSDFNFPDQVTSYFSIFDMIARHMVNVQTEIGLEHWPNIYCGVAVLILFPLYIMNTKVKLKEKAVYCVLLLFFFASFSTNVLNFIWHGFHFPNSLPCRQSFIYIFLLLFMCFRAYRNLDDVSWKSLTGVFWGAIAFVLLAQKLVTEDHFHFNVFYVTMILLAIYMGLIYLYKHPRINHSTLITLALAIVAIEAALNTTVTSITTTDRSAYLSDNQSIASLVKSVESDKDFYRFEKIGKKTKNDGAWSNFPSVSLFSSTANAALSDFFKSIGCESSTNAYSITGATPLISSLFSVKYVLSSSELEETPLISLKTQEEDTYLYSNRFTLPIAFLVPETFEDKWQYSMGDPIDVQNSLAGAIGGEDVLLKIDGETSKDTYRFTPDVSGEYYVFVSNKKVETVTATIGSRTETFNNVDRGYLLELGYCESNVEIILKSKEESQTLNASSYLFSEEGFISTFHKLNQTPFIVTEHSDSEITGIITADKKGVLFTSIPFDNGWSVLVDGVLAETKTIADTFLSMDLESGTHEITFKYVPEGLGLGLSITLLSLAILLSIDIATRMHKHTFKTKNNSQRR